MTCRTCRHYTPERTGEECRHPDVCGLMLCSLCGGWHRFDLFMLKPSARKLRCPECAGLNDIPTEDSNTIDDIDNPPAWCPGHESRPKTIQQGVLF